MRCFSSINNDPWQILTADPNLESSTHAESPRRVFKLSDSAVAHRDPGVWARLGRRDKIGGIRGIRVCVYASRRQVETPPSRGASSTVPSGTVTVRRDCRSRTTSDIGSQFERRGFSLKLVKNATLGWPRISVCHPDDDCRKCAASSCNVT